MNKELLEDWWFVDADNKMCLPKDADSVCTRILSSEGIESIDLDRKIVITCFYDDDNSDDGEGVYELGQPDKKYIEWVDKTQSDFLSFKVHYLNNWNSKNSKSKSFMKELKKI